MKRTIQRKIISIAILIFLLVIGTNTAINAIFFADKYTEAKKSELSVITKTLKAQLDRLLKLHIPIDQLAGFGEICTEFVQDNPFVSYAMVLDTDGKILYHNYADLQDQVLTNESVLGAIKSNTEVILQTSADNKDFYDFFIPVFGVDKKLIASFRTGFPVSLISENTKNIIFYSLRITTLSFAVGLILLVLSLKMWVGKPITLFINNINRIKTKSSLESQRIDIHSDDEIGELARAFNNMLNELRETTVSRNYVDNILKSMLNSLIVTDCDTVIQTVNPETLHLLGYTREELIGKSMHMIFSEHTAAKEMETENKADGKIIKAFETSYTRKDGTEVPVLFSRSAMRDRNGDLAGFICLAQDIQEIRTLRGLLPICSSCKKIRDDAGYWSQIENYISHHTKAEFSHGICPECAKKLYPDYVPQENSQQVH